MTNLESKRLKYLDFWKGFIPDRNYYFCKLLEKYGYKYELVDSKPDIIIFSCFGNYHKRLEENNIDTNIKKIFHTGENVKSVKNADLNLTFDNSTDNNNIRFPLWILYGYDKKAILIKTEKEGFCCFVYSNNVEHRNNFCKKLSKYKKVDCGGGCLNNIGGKVVSKLDFQKKYKFCIAFENTKIPGYTTEKILESYKSNCIPIYYGSNTVTDDFNPETFINANNFETEKELIDYIKKVDTDDNLYNSFMNKPIFSKKWLDIFNDTEEIFFKNIAKKIYE